MAYEQSITTEDKGYAAVDVAITMPKDQARALFHDINRMLSIVDMYAPDLGSRCSAGATQDQEAYERLHDLLNDLQRKVNP